MTLSKQCPQNAHVVYCYYISQCIHPNISRIHVKTKKQKSIQKKHVKMKHVNEIKEFQFKGCLSCHYFKPFKFILEFIRMSFWLLLNEVHRIIELCFFIEKKKTGNEELYNKSFCFIGVLIFTLVIKKKMLYN
jgi:hypothetical protein